MGSKALLLATALLATPVAATAQLNGAYTIDPAGAGSRNFTTFDAATAALGAGITGPVAFAVAPVLFRESVVIPAVAGASAGNTVSFAGTGGTATIESTGSVALTIRPGARWIRISDVHVTGTAPTGLYIEGNDHSLVRVHVTTPGASSSDIAVFLDGCERMTCVNCVFRGGTKTFHSEAIRDCVFEACEFDGAGVATRLVEPQNENDADNVFRNCLIHNCRPVGGRGVYMNLSSYGTMFWHNTIVVNSNLEAVHMGGCCGWSRACSWRNNIIANLGIGPAIVYGQTSLGMLDQFDSDYNCIYAPIALEGQSIRTERGTFRGNLAAWNAYLSSNASTLIQSGGGASYDQNSIEVEPDLVSVNQPIDLRLLNTSPLIDRGTTNYIEGPWISFPSTATVADDYFGNPRGPAVDIGAHEYRVTIRANGALVPGLTTGYDLASPSDPGSRYACVSSFTGGRTGLPGGMTLGLGVDPVFFLSVNELVPTIFTNYSGRLDATGAAQTTVSLPLVRGLVGLRLRTAFVTFELAPFALRSVSSTSTATVLPG